MSGVGGAAAGQLAGRVDALLSRFNDLQRRVAAQEPWSSVADDVEFVLPPAKNGNAEAAAGRRLLAQLRAFAQR